MSVAVCRSPAAFGFESILALTTTPTTTTTWLQSQQQLLGLPTDTPNSESKPLNQEAEKPLGDIWSSIQAQKQEQEQEETTVKEEPYVHPLMRRSSSLLSQKSLEVCTESLGSETGSEDFLTDLFAEAEAAAAEQPSKQQAKRARTEAAATVNYHCPASRRLSPPRSFPPPLPSISRRGPCLQMRPVRKDGRLVVEAVPVPTQTYLQAERQGGRLLLSFISTSNSSSNTNEEPKDETQVPVPVHAEQNEEEELMEDQQEEEEEEDEVEVVDRGTVVEVKVSTQPQQNSSGAATVKVHRSSIVINKFVSISDDYTVTATATQAQESERSPLSPVRRLSTTATTTAAAAAVAASSLSTSVATDGSHSSATDNKLLFISRRRNKDELLHDMKRCSQLRKPLFFLEPCCIATSS